MPIHIAKETKLFGVLTKKMQYVVLGLVGFMFYCNTFFNNWAYDDLMVILKNDYVQSGVAGLPKIFSGDSYEGFLKSMNEDKNQLTGGRYRPLSLATFAIEQQILGIPDVPIDSTIVNLNKDNKEADLKATNQESKTLHDMQFRHVVNVLLYLLSILALFTFLLQVVFKGRSLEAFIATLIFAIHPIHTEVVANIKGRDEILSFLFICLTLIFAFKFKMENKYKYLIFGSVSLLLALLSKEYAVMMILLLPISFYMFGEEKINKSLISSLLYLIPIFIYIIIRQSIVQPATETSEMDVMNNPYCLATVGEKLASEVSVLLNYLRLLIIPHPLTSDYSYRQIPYTNFSDVTVWLSMIVYVALVALMIYGIVKKNIIGFAIAIYLIFMAPVSNIFVNVGTQMGERFLYHSSLGFAIILGHVLPKLKDKIMNEKAGQFILVGILFALIILAAIKTINRNKDWESNNTLFLKDVKTSTNSVIVNANAGKASINFAINSKDEKTQREWLNKAVGYFNKCISLNSKYVLAYLSRGFAHLKLDEYDLALSDCDTVRKYYPVHPDLPFLSATISEHYSKIGYDYAMKNQVAEAIVNFKKGVEAKPDNYDLQYNLAFAFCQTNQVEEAKAMLSKILHEKPSHANAKNLYDQLVNLNAKK